MSLAERLNAVKKNPTLTEWLATLDPDDLAAIEEAARTWAPSRLERFIRSEGVTVSIVSISEWRATL